MYPDLEMRDSWHVSYVIVFIILKTVCYTSEIISESALKSRFEEMIVYFTMVKPERTRNLKWTHLKQVTTDRQENDKLKDESQTRNKYGPTIRHSMYLALNRASSDLHRRLFVLCAISGL